MSSLSDELALFESGLQNIGADDDFDDPLINSNNLNENTKNNNTTPNNSLPNSNNNKTEAVDKDKDASAKKRKLNESNAFIVAKPAVHVEEIASGQINVPLHTTSFINPSPSLNTITPVSTLHHYHNSIITPSPSPNSNAQDDSNNEGKDDKGEESGPKIKLRKANGKTWLDPQLEEWPEGDFRIFVGDLGNEANDVMLTKLFQHYPSFVKAKVMRDNYTQKPRGYGFVSLMDPKDGLKALTEMNGKFCGSRPMKLRKSDIDKRTLKVQKVPWHLQKIREGPEGQRKRDKRKHLF